MQKTESLNRPGPGQNQRPRSLAPLPMPGCERKINLETGSRPGGYLLERLLQEHPILHQMPDGSAADWSLTADALRYLFALLSPDSNTLETGSGYSTVAFAIAKTRHISISVDPSEAVRIRECCRLLGLPGDGLVFFHASSDLLLPSDPRIPETLDLILIDGAHRFPFPIIDWHYTQQRLRVGGILVVDDCDIPSVKVLYDFLLGEDVWALEERIDRTAFFKKLAAADESLDVQSQKMNRSHGI